MIISKAVRGFIDGALVVRLATVSAGGMPLVTPLWFGRSGDVVYVGIRRGSIQARNIGANPRVVLLFGDRHGRRTTRVLHVTGKARVVDETMSVSRRARMAWRYFVAPRAFVHWATHWRKLGVRQRYYAERKDGAMVEIAVCSADFVDQPLP